MHSTNICINRNIHSSGTHRERLCTLLDNEAFYEMGEDVRLDYGLGRFTLSIVLGAVSVPIPRGHDWSTGHPSPVNRSNMTNSTSARHVDEVSHYLEKTIKCYSVSLAKLTALI